METKWVVITVGSPVFDESETYIIGYDDVREFTVEMTEDEAAEYYADNAETVREMRQVQP